MPDVPGVQFNAPPEKLIPDLRASIDRAMATLDPGTRGAFVTVATTAGVNAALVTKAGDHVQVAAWVGKTWGGPIEGGTTVKVSW